MPGENNKIGVEGVARMVKRILGVEDGKSLARAVLETLAIIAVTFASTTAIAQPFYVPTG